MRDILPQRRPGTVGGVCSNTGMTTTAHRPTGVDDLDPLGVLARVAAAEAAERRAGADKLELALQWCVLHPATEETGVAVWADAALPAFDSEESLGGDGCPAVAAFSPEPFAAALGVSTFSGMQLLADALDLAHRLPTTWQEVRTCHVAPWKARRLAQHTHHLSARAAGSVDEQLARRIDSCGVRMIDQAVALAAARFDPDAQAEAERTGKDSWDVTLLHRTDGGWAGTSHLDATGDTVDLSKFYDLVCDHAAAFGRLGDTDPLGARKAKALGTIADGQSHLDLFGTARSSPGAEPRAEKATEPAAVRRPSLSRSRLYLHLRLSDLLDPLAPVGAGQAESLGPATLAKIREWLGSTRVTVVPVLDLSRDDAIDGHDPPGWMRESVILRDRHCVFPWCQVDARSCDLDHIIPYVPIDEGGPPGQTSPSNLAALCRRHHNAKTSGRWGYLHNRDGTYTWNGPYGAGYLVTPTVTVPLRT